MKWLSFVCSWLCSLSLLSIAFGEENRASRNREGSGTSGAAVSETSTAPGSQTKAMYHLLGPGGWTHKQNAKVSESSDGEREKVSVFDADYTKVDYSWIRKEIAQSDEIAAWEGIRLWARSEDKSRLGLTLGYFEKGSEVKFSTSFPLRSDWQERVVPYTALKREGIPITSDQLRRVSFLMLTAGKEKLTSRVFIDQIGFADATAVARMISDTPAVAITRQHELDLPVIRDRLRDELLHDWRKPLDQPPPKILEIISTMNDDGSWPDILYDDPSRARWSPAKHPERIAVLTECYVRLASTNPKRAEIRAAMDRSMNDWFRRDPRCKNWWWNMIGVPMIFSKIAILLDEDLSAEQHRAISAILRRSDTENMTGENLVWTASMTVMRGVFDRSPAIVLAAFEKIEDEIRVAPGLGEGIKEDRSFHQHGQQLYSGGYGAGFATDASRFFAYAVGTAYAFPPEKSDLLTSYILDGTRWMLYRNVLDYSVRGREITRPAKIPSPSFLLRASRSLKGSVGPHQQELIAFCEELERQENSLIGNKHFWQSDYMSHRRAGWMMSVKMLSSRMKSGELVNGEGQKSHLLSDGVCYLYTGDGLAYHNIFPIWDWKRLPGITAEWSPESPTGPVSSLGTSDFAGGVSDGTYGAGGFIHERGRLKAHKSWFFFDDECVALGAGITSGDIPAYTSLEQNLKHGDVMVSESGKVHSLNGELNSEDVEWVHHRGAGYFFLQKEKMLLREAMQTGSWREIASERSGDPVSAEVFSLSIDHGRQASGASYQYLVAPMELDEFQNYVHTVPVHVLANTPELAAVEHVRLGIVEAVFYQAGVVKTLGGTLLSVDQPCLLMLRRKENSWSISASNPRNAPMIVGVTISGPSGKKEFKIALPTGDDAGKSVTVAE